MRRQTTRLGVPVTIVGIVAALVLGFFVVMLSYTPVDVGTVALVKRFGGLTGEVFEPGLHWRTPFVDQVIIISTVVQSYETSDSPETSGSDYRDYPVNAQTIDGQQIIIKYTVLFRIPPDKAADIVQNVGIPRVVAENIVKAHSRNLTRLSVQSHTAEDLYSGEGIFAYEDNVRNELTEVFERYGIFLDDFLVRKIEFDEEYINAIEQQQIAQEAIETARYQADAAEYEKQSKIRLAEADAEGIRLLAAANAEQQRLLADSEAYSIDARGKALKEFPGLVQWEFVRNLEDIQWGILPGDGITPLMPLPSFEGQEETPALVIPETPGEGE